MAWHPVALIELGAVNISFSVGPGVPWLSPVFIWFGRHIMNWVIKMWPNCMFVLTRVVKSIDTQKSIDTEKLYLDTIFIFKSIDTVLPPVAPKQSFI